MIIDIYNAIFYQPIFNLLIWFYNIIPGNEVIFSIILLTLVIKLILFPLTVKQIKSQKALQDLQPKMQELKKKYKDKPQEMTQKTMELYKQEKISPFSSCLPILVQLPFLIAVYQVFRKGLTNGQSYDILYNFVQAPQSLNPIAFNLVDLSSPNVFLAAAAGIAQYWVSKMLISKKQPNVNSAKDEKMTAMMNKQMTFFLPIFTVFIGLSLPSGLMIYWLTTTLLTGLQQIYLFKKKDTKNEVQVDEKTTVIKK